MLITLNTSPPDAPKLPSVSVSPSAEIEEGSSVTLTCSSDANPAANYIWYKRNVNADLSSVSEGPLFVLSSIQSSDSGQYCCRAENLLEITRSESILIDVKYAPKLPSVSVSPSTGIKEGSSVTLTCSSDANPAANYTWYKKNEDSPKASGQIFTITDFRAEHSGSYSCGAQNKLGRSNSTFHLIVVAGSSTMIVNIIGTTLGVLMLILALLLSLWTRKKKALRSTTEAHEPIGIEVRENAHLMETKKKDVEMSLWRARLCRMYAPKLPSVSVSPSAEIEEGSSVTLTCSSDANPAANYTWYKENEDSPKASGQIFTITDFRAEHSGSYSCGAQNKLGRSNSTFHLSVGTGSSTMMVNIIGTTLGVLMLILALLLSLWMRKKKALRSTTEAPAPEEIELDSDPEYENDSHTAAQTEDTEEQEDMV
ncbi:hypothetical protein JOQ06_012677 [Pogonophryne albipinna]|uniref:Ig-like domain-containing protein n=1 Tax=Pogonophryne albipinna TaxID=1090488 RepID=A0AAD6BJG4_9TELE|nr:hypothetical protein JOQ06_012677 [Pogonophryne albipinna]